MAASASILAAAPAVVLYDNSNVTTGVGNGFNGANTSAVAASSATFGYSANSIVGPMTVSIWSAQPGTAGAVVLFTSTTLATTAWTGIYRVTTTTLTNAQRPLFT